LLLVVTGPVLKLSNCVEWLRRVSAHFRRADSEPEHLRSGRRGEELACWYLRERGYTILARNYRRPPWRGEIDIIAVEGDKLVFVEVKTRQVRGEYPAEQAVNRDKRRNLVQLGRAYARRRGRTADIRFDVVTVYGLRNAGDATGGTGEANDNAEVALYKDVFDVRGNPRRQSL
jgi:putative endonuclease